MFELNYEETESHPQSVLNIKPFINNYTLKGISYPSVKKLSALLHVIT